MRDFNQQLKAYRDEMKNTRCPYSDAELNKEIRSVIWNTNNNPLEAQSMASCRYHSRYLHPNSNPH